MSMAVPLGVRIYCAPLSLDVWVTQWVSGLNYRSVIPGGFASASFTLHMPQHLAPVTASWTPRAPRTNLVRLFNRVQVVDLRTGQIEWEGRIASSPRSGSDSWAFDISCAGAMVAATDITRPVYYVDSEVEHWYDMTGISHIQWNGANKDEDQRTFGFPISSSMTYSQSTANDMYPGFTHQLSQRTGQYVGRFSLTYNLIPGSGGNIAALRASTNLHNDPGDPAPITWAHAGVDNTVMGTGTQSRKTNVRGTDWTESQISSIAVGVYSSSATDVTPTSTKTTTFSFEQPVVVAQRMDRYGNQLIAASNYTTDYVTVSQVVEDVLGRFLGDWYSNQGIINVVGGSVGTKNAYIDTSDTNAITNLKWPDGTTAQEILNTMMTVQANSYWAIWESSMLATDDPASSKYRFEWTTWPASWGYLASSADGIDEQPDGDDIYNFVYEIYGADYGYYVLQPAVQEWWDYTDPPYAPLLTGNFSRSAVQINDTDGSNSQAITDGQNFIAANGAEKNAGTITIARPIQIYDPGSNSFSGRGGMIDPHSIRPGKLLRVTDLPAAARNEVMTHGGTAPPYDHIGSVWRVVGTNYDAERNECVLELDQPSTWTIPGQITAHGGKRGNIQTLIN